jgi:DNA-binding MarR family transcriptional regulator
MDAWSLFLSAHALLVADIEARLAAAELPPLAWYDALWALERTQGRRLRLGEFERWMVISRSNITRLIDRLEQAGLVVRERSAEDGRGAYAVLTPEGRRMRRKMWTVYGPAIEALFERPLGAAAQPLAEAMQRLIAAQRSA